MSIGNSDGKLPPRRWAEFLAMTDRAIWEVFGGGTHGIWYSLPTSRYQNACWCFTYEPHDEPAAETLKAELAGLASRFDQDSIAWAVAEIEFLTAMPKVGAR